MPYFICVQLTEKEAKGIEVSTYTLNDKGMILTAYEQKAWVIRDWVYIKEL